jgi:factor associated with neutral sphingomyelinase activation
VSVTGAGRRKYDLHNVALEVFFQGNEPPVFFSFQTAEDRNSFEAALQKRVPTLEARGGYSAAHLSQWTREWVSGNISNSRYLSILNEAAGRSINDFMQYPIFPWVLTDYVSTTLDLDDPAVYRDLSRPVAALNNARLQHGRETYEATKPMMGQTRAWMYGSHYSNPGIVVFYLVRSCPNLMLRLQSGRFDIPERLFTSVGGAWASVMKWNSDVKELIPEFYTPGAEQFLLKPAGADLNHSSSGESTALQDVVITNPVMLPPWARSPEDFVSKMAEALEAPAVSSKLHKWINLIFGVKSRGKAALKADNLFHYMTDDAM